MTDPDAKVRGVETRGPLSEEELAQLVCLVPRDGLEGISSHEKTLCDCRVLALNDALIIARKERDEARAALKKIHAMRGMTQLSECCVHKNCSPLYDEGEKVAECKWQAGVSRGFSECADIASEALAKLEEKF